MSLFSLDIAWSKSVIERVNVYTIQMPIPATSSSSYTTVAIQMSSTCSRYRSHGAIRSNHSSAGMTGRVRLGISFARRWSSGEVIFAYLFSRVYVSMCLRKLSYSMNEEGISEAGSADRPFQTHCFPDSPIHSPSILELPSAVPQAAPAPHCLAVPGADLKRAPKT